MGVLEYRTNYESCVLKCCRYLRLFARGLLRATMSLIVIKKTLTCHAVTANEDMELIKQLVDDSSEQRFSGTGCHVRAMNLLN